MKSHKIFTVLFIIVLVIGSKCQTQTKSTDRQPAVAGQFYPANSDELKSELKQLFSNSIQSKQIKDVVAIIVPHAGYVFSGEVAASGFNQIDTKKEYDNIFIIGSSHHIAFEGASIYSQGNYITPLGTVKVNTELAEQLIKKNKLFSNRIDAHLKEHSLEVQLPFLQYIMKKNFKIVPIVLGTQSPETCKRIAESLRPYLNKNNLFVISTDFSHYPSYDDAHKVDKATADAILTNSPQRFLKTINEYERKGIRNLYTCICGWTSVLTLLYMTEHNLDFEFTHIQYKNSGDVDIGDKNRVVGYHAIAVSIKQQAPSIGEKEEKTEFKLNDKDRKDLLKIARNTIMEFLQNRRILEVDESKLTATVKVHCGAFVTLKKHGELRGCIGRFDANEPLYKVVQQMAIASATEDYRFQPVEQKELSDIDIEISVLTPMRKIKTIDEIQMGKHGIYIRKGNRGGTFLPQVATETGWTKEEFLGHCAQDKAGIGWNGWKDAEIYIYEALVFGEK